MPTGACQSAPDVRPGALGGREARLDVVTSGSGSGRAYPARPRTAGPPTGACTAAAPPWSIRMPDMNRLRRPQGSWWQWHREATRLIVAAAERAEASALIAPLGSALDSRASRPASMPLGGNSCWE